MAEQDKSFFNRRELARSAMIGGASVLLGSAALGAQSAQGAPGGGELLDARKQGAVGDGKTDDTLALQRAFDAAAVNSGGVFLPPGVYLTQELHVRPGTAIMGVAAWNYSGPGGSVLRLADAGPHPQLSGRIGPVEGAAVADVAVVVARDSAMVAATAERSSPMRAMSAVSSPARSPP